MPQSPYNALADDALWTSLIVAGLGRLPPAEATSEEIAAFLTPVSVTLGAAGATRVKQDRLVSVQATCRLAYPDQADTPITLRGVCLLSAELPPTVLALYELPQDVRLSARGHYVDVGLDVDAARVVDQE